MSNGFQAGDTVQLKSGGPAMTIESFEGDSQNQGAVCSWFDDKKNHQRKWFHIASLKKADE